MLRALIYLLPLALTIYAFIDCLNTPEDEVKHLPKVAWVFIILLFWIVGPIVWLAAGKTRADRGAGRTPSEWHRNRRTTWVAPDDNPDFLKSLKDEKADEKAEAAEGEKDEAELKAREADLRRREEEIKRREGGAGSQDASS
ncbi:PLD nuclease N-terminal domain-containing protein [Streptomyces sp. NPDC058637]|uniref:PLD nuclease N-terminal domain-containing protein n=1 Tax=Streptomyces sp. NPDC058637 TaxID=3346569 RepID=UPI00366301EB